jgi:effector-binding domain-containing protein
MKLLLKILLGLAVLLVLVFFAGAAFLPDRITVERSVRIERPAGMVFALANDLSRFNEWSPWYPLDPDASYRYEGPARGRGATMHWSGEKSVGTGTLRILKSEAPSRVLTEVSFEGFEPPARAELRIAPDGDDASHASWTFDAALEGATARWFGLIMPRYIGEDFARGLALLKQRVEAQPAAPADLPEVTQATLAPQDVIALSGSAPAGDMEAVSAVLGELYGQLVAFAAGNDLEITGAPLTLTAELPGDTWQFEAALPVRLERTIVPDGAIQVKQTPGGAALVIEHVGPYEGLAQVRAQLDAWAIAYGHTRSGPVQDIYVSDPADTPPEALVTRIIYPVAAQE